MAGEQTQEQQQVSDDKQTEQRTEQQVEPNVSELEAKVAEYEAELAKANEILEKARKGEKYHKNKAEAEVKKVQALYEQEKARADGLELKIRNQAIDQVVRQVLGESGAKAVDTAMKLVDRSAIKFDEDGSVDVESVKSVVDKMKETDSILFGAQQNQQQVVVQAPKTVRATETDKISGYAAELAAAKNSNEVMAVMKKYGKA